EEPGASGSSSGYNHDGTINPRILRKTQVRLGDRSLGFQWGGSHSVLWTFPEPSGRLHRERGVNQREAHPGIAAMSPPMSLASSMTARAALWRGIIPGFLTVLVLGACASKATADEEQPPKASVRTLQGDDAQQVESLTKTIEQLESDGQFADAVEPAR